MEKNLQGLDSWLNFDTWHTSHPLDETRFYVAVYRVLKSDVTHSVTPDEIKNYILSKYNGKFAADFLEAKATDAAEKFEIISEFVAANKI